MNAVTVTVGATFFLPTLNGSKFERMLWCALRRRAFPVNRCFFQFRISECRYAHILASAKPFSEVPKIRAFALVGSSWMYLPILGPYHGLDLSAAAWQMHRRYGLVVAEELPGRNFVVHLFSANDIRTLCQKETKMPYRMGIDPFKLYHIERPEYFSNCGILNAQGEEWQHIRNMGQSSILRPRVIESFAKRIDKVTSDAVQLIASHRDHNGDVAGCFEILTRWSMETIVDVTLGRRLGLLENQLKSEAARIMTGATTFMESMETLVMHFPYYRYFPTPTSWRWRHAGDIIAPIYRRITKDAAEGARASNGTCKKSTVLQHLCCDNIEFKEMFTLLHDIIFAGIHTTSAMATYTLHCLAMNPKAQEMAQQEVGSLPEEVLSSTVTVPSIAACVKEALRLYPIVPGVNIKLRDDIVLSGYRIPKNVVVRTEQFVVGRLEENFNRASEFLPERWLRSAKQRKGESATEGEVFTTHPFGSLAFGFGPRSCLGKRVAELEVCTLVAKVLKKYKLENHHGDIGFRTMITARPERPVNFRFIERALI